MGGEKSPIEFNERIGKGQEKWKGRSKSKETRKKLMPIPMPMMGMEMTDDLPGLCVSHPSFVPAFSKCRMVVIVKGRDRSRGISLCFVALCRFVELAN